MSNYFKTIILITLIIYSTFVFRIIFPLLDYVINYSFIVAELCVEKDNPQNMCMGKCHLQNEIRKQVNETNKSPKIVSIEFLKIPHSSAKIVINNIFKTSVYLIYQFTTNSIHLNYEPKTPPPKF